MAKNIPSFWLHQIKKETSYPKKFSSGLVNDLIHEMVSGPICLSRWFGYENLRPSRKHIADTTERMVAPAHKTNLVLGEMHCNLLAALSQFSVLSTSEMIGILLLMNNKSLTSCLCERRWSSSFLLSFDAIFTFVLKLFLSAVSIMLQRRLELICSDVKKCLKFNRFLDMEFELRSISINRVHLEEVYRTIFQSSICREAQTKETSASKGYKLNECKQMLVCLLHVMFDTIPITLIRYWKNFRRIIIITSDDINFDK